MFDREKSEPQTDIDFDFFDESPTAEAVPGDDGGPRRRRKLPTRPPAPPGGPQLYRRAVLIGAAIVLAVILIVVVDSCRKNQKQSEYEGYVDSVATVASESAAIGDQLNASLTESGISLEDLRANIEGLRGQQEQVLRTAQTLTPPGPLVEQQESLVETMQFRVNGLDGLAGALAQVAQTSDNAESGALLAQQAQRLVASDIVYQDAFKAAAQEVLQQQGVSDVSVADSVFVQNPELGGPREWTQIVQRLTQSPQAGGLHGNGIEAVRVQPGGQELSTSEDNTVESSDQLSFQVLVLNSGDNQEVQVAVTLVIQQDPVIRKKQTIDLINPGETKTVTFRNFGNISFSTKTTLKVTVEPVPGEERTGNNTAEFPIIFSL